MARVGIRPLTTDLVPEVEHLLAAKRAEYAVLSPRFWRPARDAVALHELYLRRLLSNDATLGLTTAALDAVLIATPRDDGWLIDDFAVASPSMWAHAGAALLDAAGARCQGPITVVCAHDDVAQRVMLDSAGLHPHEQWWVAERALLPRPTDDVDPATLPTASIAPAPPVYDPGGPVAIVSDWDGERASLVALAFSLRQQCVLIVVPIDHADRRRQRVVEALGFTVASIWYR